MERKSNLYTLQDLLTMPLPKPESIINGLLFVDETALFIARQKEGKSTLMLQLCLDVAAGQPFLGRYPCSKRTVLYVDYENRPYRIRERAKDMLSEKPVPDMHYYALDSLAEREVGLRREAEFQALGEIVAQVHPGLLVLDPLRYAVGGELDEQTSMLVIERVAVLKQANPDMAVILVHHTRKGGGDNNSIKLKANPRDWVDKVYGSQALLAHVETIWGLEKGDDGYTFATVARSQSGLNLRLSKDQGSEGFVFDAETKKELTEAEKIAWEKLPSSFTWSQAINFGIGSSTLHRTINRAMSSGLLSQDRDSKKYQKLPDTLEERNITDEIVG